jgi:hypothetical protein
VKAAVSIAVNRKRDRVEEKDIFDGERMYSQYALDSILVENVETFPQLEALQFKFAGSASIVTEDEIHKVAARCGIAEDRWAKLIEHLTPLSFLGLEIDEGRFAFSEETLLRSLLDAPELKLRVAESASAMLGLAADPEEWEAEDYKRALDETFGPPSA